MSVVESRARRTGAHSQISECDVAVDAMLGTGFAALTGLLRRCVADVNALGAPSCHRPSEVCPRTRRKRGGMPSSVETVTMPPRNTASVSAAIPCGGSRDRRHGFRIRSSSSSTGPYLELMKCDDARDLQARGGGFAQGRFGRVLIVAGSMAARGGHLAASCAAIGPGLVRSRTALVRAWSRRWRGIYTEPLDETPAGGIDFAALDRVWDEESLPSGPAIGGPSARRVGTGVLERAPCPS